MANPVTRLISWLKGLRRRRQERIADDYGYLSKHDRESIAKLRDEHNPGRGGGGP